MSEAPKCGAQDSSGEDEKSAKLDRIVEVFFERDRRERLEMLHRVSQWCQALAVAAKLTKLSVPPRRNGPREFERSIETELEKIDDLSAWETLDAWVPRPCGKDDPSTRPNHPVRNFLECPTLCQRCCAAAVRHLHLLAPSETATKPASHAATDETSPLEIKYVEAKTKKLRTLDSTKEVLASLIVKKWEVPKSTLQRWGLLVLGRTLAGTRVFDLAEATARYLAWKERTSGADEYAAVG